MSKIIKEKVSKAVKGNIASKKQTSCHKYKCPLRSLDIFLMATVTKRKIRD